jgi:hypothetical protein
MSNFHDKVRNNVKTFNKIRLELKKDSPFYPDILTREYEQETGRYLYLSTTIRIQRDGKWYKVHCIESIACMTITPKFWEQQLIQRLIRNVYICQLFHQINTELINSDGESLQDIDENQISEKQRMIDLFKK